MCNLNSAGLEQELARYATKTALAVSKVAQGDADNVAPAMATAYNNLGSRFQGTVKEKFAMIGGMLTKTQFKYQIANFNQFAETMKYGAAAINKANTELNQSFAILGALNTAGYAGG